MTSYETVEYDHVGAVRAYGALGTNRCVPCPDSWVPGDAVGLVLGAPDGVAVTLPSTVPVDTGTPATGAPAADLSAALVVADSRYDAAVHLLAHLLRDPDVQVADVVQVRPHQGTLLDGREVSDRVASVLCDVDAYIAEHEWDDR